MPGHMQVLSKKKRCVFGVGPIWPQSHTPPPLLYPRVQDRRAQKMKEEAPQPGRIKMRGWAEGEGLHGLGELAGVRRGGGYSGAWALGAVSFRQKGLNF